MPESMTKNIIEREGGYSNHDLDKGGETKYGITLYTFAEYKGWESNEVYKLKNRKNPIEARAKMVDMLKQITEDDAVNIYEKLFYKRYNISSVQMCVRESVYDMCVNAGKVGIELYQQMLSDFGFDIKVDGINGEKTTKKANRALERKGRIQFKNKYNDLRRNYYIELAKKKPSQKAFVWGWVKRAQHFLPKEKHYTRERTMELVNVN